MKASKAGVLKVGDWRIDSINKKSRGVGGKSYIEQKDQSELFSNVLWNILEIQGYINIITTHNIPPSLET